MKPELPAAEAMDIAFQDKLLVRLQELAGVALPGRTDAEAMLLNVK
jgi:hypothetical protein